MEDRIPRWLHYHCDVCCKKDGYYERWACIVDIENTVLL